MLLRYFTKVNTSSLLARSFATATTRDRVNYYDILRVDSSATEANIRKAYAELTEGLTPQRDGNIFRQLNEAFVILTDNKTRDAYDSLLSVRKSFYMSSEAESAPVTKSYLATRKQNRLEQLKKRLNIDEFGRYRGGLPNQKKGGIRGKSRGEVGTMHSARQIEEALDPHPEYHNITSDKAESFKNFHQDEREAREMKWPWTTFEIDYQFFTLDRVIKKYWLGLKWVLLVTFIIPTYYYAWVRYQKDQLVEELRKKKTGHA